MSRRHVERLGQVRDEFEAASATLAYIESEWGRVKRASLLRGTSQAAVRTTRSNLENTYILRMFALFEGLLRTTVASTRRRQGRSHNTRLGIHNLIELSAPLYAIPDPVREDVHRLREYHNLLTHEASKRPAAAFDFDHALSYLGIFLDLLPDAP